MTIQGILESCLYTEDLRAAETFYRDVLGLEQISKERNRHLFYKCGDAMLLIFNPAYTLHKQSFVNGDPVPLHGTKGSAHLAFAIGESEFSHWKNRLREHSVEIESEVTWPNGHRSIYFRDPEGNSIELVSPAIWQEE